MSKYFIILFFHSIIIFSEPPIFSIGPTYGNNFNEDIESIGFDISLTLPHSLISQLLIVPSLSLNPRVLRSDNKQNNYSLDIQTTFYLIFFNIGGGYGYNSKYEFQPHFFCGLPIGYPVIHGALFKFIYIEPYYRLDFYDNKNHHEFGLMFKISTLRFIE